MSDEHIKVLREMRPGTSCPEEQAALDAAIAALGGVVEVAEVLGWNNDATPKLRINVKLHQIPVGTRLYALPAPPSKEG